MIQNAPTEDERRRGRSFVLCADDYALTPAVSAGILRLLSLGRLTATGAMTNRPHWRSLAGELAQFAGAADLGVHLNLTSGAPLGPMPMLAPDGALPAFATVARLAFRSGQARLEIAAELVRQLDSFEAAMGRKPEFVDGHQHVHALPGVGAALIAILAERYGGADRFYLRDPADRLSAILRRAAPAKTRLKAMVVAALATGFGARARRARLATNDGFSGFSAFDATVDYGAELAGALIAPGRSHLVMCHPGEIDDELRAIDSVVETRPQELALIASERFLDICAIAGMRLGRMDEAWRDARQAKIA